MSFPGGCEHGQGSLGILHTDRSVVRHLHGLDRSLAPTTTSTAWWTLCGPMTRRCGPAGSAGARLPAMWPPAHHRPTSPAMDTPIALTPKRPSGRGENLAMKKTGQALTAAGGGKDWGCLAICPPKTQDVGSDLMGPPPPGLTWGVAAGRACPWVIFQLSPPPASPSGPPWPH